jgi:hypothetical protein
MATNLVEIHNKVKQYLGQAPIQLLITNEELQYLVLVEFSYTQSLKRLQFNCCLVGNPPTGSKVLGIVAFGALGFFAAPLLGIGALTGVLIGAAIGWRLFGGGKKASTKNSKQARVVSAPGFDSAPQPPNIGSVIPLIFTNAAVNFNGGVRLNGNIINSYVKTFQNKQTLYTLVALGLGEIGDIDNTQLLIDNQPLDNFFSGVIEAKYVTGTKNQARFENYPNYSQSVSPSNNNTFGTSFRGKLISGSSSNNSFNVEEADYDSIIATERYKLNGIDFRVTNKIITGSTYKIITNTNFSSVGDRKIYATFRAKYKTALRCSRIDLNFAFDISARDKTSNELTTFALVFNLYLNGQFVRRFYEANKKEGTIRRSLTLSNLNYQKHVIEITSLSVISDSVQPLRLDDSGVVRTINSGVFSAGKEIQIVVESNPNNQQSISKINGFLNVDNKASTSADRGANARITTINEVTLPSDLGHSYMSNYQQLVLQDLKIEASDNLQSSPAVATLVRKGIKYRNHLSAGNASINSQNNILVANGANFSGVQLGHVCRNISRQTESIITAINGFTITTQFSLNWQPGESFLIYFEDSVNYFPDIFVYTRLNKQGGVRGLAISEKFIDYPSICEARRFCKANNFFWDGVVEQETKWNSWVLQESLASLLFPFKYAGNYGLKYESPSNPTDIFNASRIYPGTYTQSKPDSTKINCVQLTYNSNDENYTKIDKTITVMTADAYYNREALQIENLNYDSITNEEQAKAVAGKYLKSLTLQNKVVEFTTGLAGFNCREGDLIVIQYALTETESEVSGFCLSAGTLSSGNQEITLSKIVNQGLFGYQLSVYHLETGLVETGKSFTVLPSGNLLITGLSQAILPPRESFNGDVVVINRDISEKLFRISTLKPENYGVKITAVNWTADIHNLADLFFIT